MRPIYRCLRSLNLPPPARAIDGYSVHGTPGPLLPQLLAIGHLHHLIRSVVDGLRDVRAESRFIDATELGRIVRSPSDPHKVIGPPDTRSRCHELARVHTN